MGLEPTTFGTTIRRSNQLSYSHRVFYGCKDNTIVRIVQEIGEKNQNKSVERTPLSQCCPKYFDNHHKKEVELRNKMLP